MNEGKRGRMRQTSLEPVAAGDSSKTMIRARQRLQALAGFFRGCHQKTPLFQILNLRRLTRILKFSANSAGVEIGRFTEPFT